MAEKGLLYFAKVAGHEKNGLLASHRTPSPLNILILKLPHPHNFGDKFRVFSVFEAVTHKKRTFPSRSIYYDITSYEVNSKLQYTVPVQAEDPLVYLFILRHHCPQV